MTKNYLATGFTNVDNSDDIGDYSSCLTTLDNLSYFRKYKEQSYRLLDIQPGDTVLDAGCGLGYDARRMAELVTNSGQVIGIDASHGLIREASRLHSEHKHPLQFITGDIRKLAFADSTFSQCRIDRVLQHVEQPDRAIHELFRVLKPGGMVLAYENDWGAFTISSSDQDTTRAVENYWCHSFTNGRIGRNLTALFTEAGFTNTSASSMTSTVNEYKLANEFFNIEETVDRLVDSNVLPKAKGQAWINDLRTRDKKECFSIELTAYIATGQKKSF